MATLSIDPTKVRPLLGSTLSQGIVAAATQCGRLHYLAADGLWYETDADAEVSCVGAIAMVVAGNRRAQTGVLANGETATLLLFGRVFLGDDVALDGSKQYFVSNTVAEVNGLISDVAGTIKRRVGNPEDSGIFFFAPYAVNSDYPGGA